MNTTHTNRIRQWVAALTSGKFRQGKNMLRTPRNNYCCLGVACEVYHQATGKGRWEKRDKDWYFVVGNASESSAMPEAVMRWFGLPDNDPDLLQRGGEAFGKQASSLNDGGTRFPTIARAIERTFLTKRED